MSLTPHEKDDLDRHIMDQFAEPADYDDEYWVSACRGATPHESTPDVGEGDRAGVCGQYFDHAGFERHA